MTTVGIVDVSSYAPARLQTAEEIAALCGIPADVIRDKFGLSEKRLAAPDEHVSDLAAKAACELLRRHPTRPLDVVMYMGSPYRDYHVWSAAPKVQQLLGAYATGSYAMDLQGVSSGTPTALALAKGLFAADPHINDVLLAGGSREHDLIDYANPRSRFMFNFAAGGAALLLRRDHPVNHVLATYGFTDGRFADDVMVPAGGSKEPPSHATIDAGRHSLDVRDPAAMKAGLDPITVENFIRAARTAVERSGMSLANVALVCPIHTKRSLYESVMHGLGLKPEQGVYLSDRGHMSALDPLVGLARARDEGRLHDGDVVLLLAAGTGYTWAATVVRWGRA